MDNSSPKYRILGFTTSNKRDKRQWFDPISRLLCSKIAQHGPAADKEPVPRPDPSRRGHGPRRDGLCCLCVVPVQLHRELKLDEDLPAGVPKGFEELRGKILGYGKEDAKEEDSIAGEGKMGVYMVVTYDIRGSYGPGLAESEGL